MKIVKMKMIEGVKVVMKDMMRDQIMRVRMIIRANAVEEVKGLIEVKEVDIVEDRGIVLQVMCQVIVQMDLLEGLAVFRIVQVDQLVDQAVYQIAQVDLLVDLAVSQRTQEVLTWKKIDN